MITCYNCGNYGFVSSSIRGSKNRLYFVCDCGCENDINVNDIYKVYPSIPVPPAFHQINNMDIELIDKIDKMIKSGITIYAS